MTNPTSSWGFTSPAMSQNVAAVREQRDVLLGKDLLFDGDYGISAAGDYVLLEGIEALRQAIYRRLLTRPGEFRARPEYGVGVLDFVKKRNTLATLDELRQRVFDQLSLDDRISEVRSVVVETIVDGLQIGVVIEAAGETLRFEPFDFRQASTLGTLGVPEGTGIDIG